MTERALTGAEVRDLNYHERCRTVAKSLGRTLHGSDTGGGFSTTEGDRIMHGTMEAIDALRARLAEVERERDEAVQRARVAEGHIRDASGTLRRVLGKLPLAKTGEVIGTEAEVSVTFGGRTFMVRTAPTLTAYSPGIDGAPLYEFHPEEATPHA